MSELYFLERMMRERVWQIERDAQLRSRLGVSRQKGDSVSVRLRQWLGGWLIRVGQCFQGRPKAFNQTTARSNAETSTPTSFV
jgi:hypothetical protein